MIECGPTYERSFEISSHSRLCFESNNINLLHNTTQSKQNLADMHVGCQQLRNLWTCHALSNRPYALMQSLLPIKIDWVVREVVRRCICMRICVCVHMCMCANICIVALLTTCSISDYAVHTGRQASNIKRWRPEHLLYAGKEKTDTLRNVRC